jgi:hypothetical protein
LKKYKTHKKDAKSVGQVNSRNTKFPPIPDNIINGEFEGHSLDIKLYAKQNSIINGTNNNKGN